MADDLSGALEIAGAACASGFRASVALNARGWSDICASEPVPDAVVWCSNVRSGSETQIAERMSEGLVRMSGWQGEGLYLKMDSTMRGPVSRELQVVLQAADEARILMTPANPAAGRTVRHSNVHVHGVPLVETAFRMDPLFPIRTSHVPTLLEPLKTQCLALEAVRSDAETLGDCLKGFMSMDAQVLVADAETDTDLDRLAGASLRLDRRPFFAGSAGLFRALVRAGWLGSPPDESAAPPALRSSGPRLFVNGSRHPASREQFFCLQDSAHITAVTVDPATAHLVAGERADALSQYAHSLRDALQNDGLAILQIGSAADTASQGVSAREASLRLPEILAAIVAEADVDVPVDTFFVSGGDTAQALCEVLGAERIDALAEYAQGAVWGRLAGKGASRTLFLKPGGYGEAKLLLEALDWLDNCILSRCSVKGTGG